MCCDSWGHKESDMTERLNCTYNSFILTYSFEIILFIIFYCIWYSLKFSLRV